MPPTHPYSDTDVDGDVSIDSDGNFVPDHRALDLFDYFFIDSGRLSDAQIIAQVHDWLASRLVEPALSQARAFFTQYLALRSLAAQAYGDGSRTTTARERLELIQALRVQTFGAALTERLYGQQYRLQVARLDRMEAASRGEVIDPHQGLSPAEITVYERTQAVLAVEQMDGDGNAEQLWLQRSEAYGYDAAYRLAELDERRRVWAGRVEAYRREKATLETDKSLDDDERTLRQRELLDKHFTRPEQARVKALEKIDNDTR